MSNHSSQNPLWKRGQSGVASKVDLTSDPERAMGLSTVTEIQQAIDIVEDTQRSLGHVVVSNDPGISGTVDVAQTASVDVADNYTRELGKARVLDSGGVLVDPLDADEFQPITAETTITGTADAAVLALGAHRKQVDVYYDLSGAATVTVEFSPDDGTNWYELDTVTEDAAATGTLSVSTAFADVRAYADANLNTLLCGSKGA